MYFCYDITQKFSNSMTVVPYIYLSVFKVPDKNRGREYLFTPYGWVMMKMACRGNLQVNMDSKYQSRDLVCLLFKMI
jgi:hypothetical protein